MRRIFSFCLILTIFTVVIKGQNTFSGDFKKDNQFITALIQQNPAKLKTSSPLPEETIKQKLNIQKIYKDEIFYLVLRQKLKPLLTLHKAETIQIYIFKGKEKSYFWNNSLFINKDFIDNKYLLALVGHELGHLYKQPFMTSYEEEFMADAVSAWSLYILENSTNKLKELLSIWFNYGTSKTHPSLQERIEHIEFLTNEWHAKQEKTS